MSASAADPFAPLLPAAVERMPVAWRHLRVPGPPPELALTPAETAAGVTPLARFHRRTIQLLDCGAARCGDRLALVDKASPHAQFDLMLSEVSERPKSTPDAVLPVTGRMLWQTGLGFVRFASDPAVRRAFGLDGGRLHLALNCDPYTSDRESVQAAKQFHLHLLYWTAAELAPLGRPDRVADTRDPRRRRQYLDPLAFLGARIVSETLADAVPRLCGAQVLAPDDGLVCAGRRPLGALLRLPGWAVLGGSGFEELVRHLHQRLAELARTLLETFTGETEPPPRWRRHPLLPPAQIAARIDGLELSVTARAGLKALALALRDLPPASAERLAGASPPRRMHCMTLNQPCYGLNLFAPEAGDAPPIDAPEVLLAVQVKLFSGIGGAGLVSLDGVPSVRVLRGCGSYTAADWERRAAFQRAFAEHNAGALRADLGSGCGPLRRFQGGGAGWV